MTDRSGIVLNGMAMGPDLWSCLPGCLNRPTSSRSRVQVGSHALTVLCIPPNPGARTSPVVPGEGQLGPSSLWLVAGGLVVGRQGLERDRTEPKQGQGHSCEPEEQDGAAGGAVRPRSWLWLQAACGWGELADAPAGGSGHSGNTWQLAIQHWSWGETPSNGGGINSDHTMLGIPSTMGSPCTVGWLAMHNPLGSPKRDSATYNWL